MIKNEVLNKLYKNDIALKTAYDMLYPKIKHKKPKKAHFVKLNVRIPDSKAINVLIKILFLFPMPIFILRLIGKKKLNSYVSEDINISFKDVIDMASIKGTSVHVDTQDQTKVLIKTI